MASSELWAPPAGRQAVLDREELRAPTKPREGDQPRGPQAGLGAGGTSLSREPGAAWALDTIGSTAFFFSFLEVKSIY